MLKADLFGFRFNKLTPTFVHVQILFHKYQGTGNDFIMIDNRTGKIQLSVDQIKWLCDRKFGIGSDGILLLEQTDFADFYVNFYNPDGSVSFCGNGSRCAVKFAHYLEMINDTGSFKAIDGNHPFEISALDVKIKMRNVLGIEYDDDHFVIHTGSPHYIVRSENVDAVDVKEAAKKIRYSARFKEEGINVNFIQTVNDDLYIRTYERGVEDETLSCGTGVTAAALSWGYLHPALSELKVLTKGGELKVSFQNLGDGSFEDIWLQGPAEFVFSGEVNI